MIDITKQAYDDSIPSIIGETGVTLNIPNLQQDYIQKLQKPIMKSMPIKEQQFGDEWDDMPYFENPLPKKYRNIDWDVMAQRDPLFVISMYNYAKPFIQKYEQETQNPSLKDKMLKLQYRTVKSLTPQERRRMMLGIPEPEKLTQELEFREQIERQRRTTFAMSEEERRKSFRIKEEVIGKRLSQAEQSQLNIIREQYKNQLDLIKAKKDPKDIYMQGVLDKMNRGESLNEDEINAFRKWLKLDATKEQMIAEIMRDEFLDKVGTEYPDNKTAMQEFFKWFEKSSPAGIKEERKVEEKKLNLQEMQERIKSYRPKIIVSLTDNIKIKKLNDWLDDPTVPDIEKYKVVSDLYKEQSIPAKKEELKITKEDILKTLNTKE